MASQASAAGFVIMGSTMSSAKISECGQYRYWLRRGEGNPLLFCMLNPSTADASQDDPTIRRCKSFAQAAGFDSILVVNLYAYRATAPASMLKAVDPVGPDNDYHLLMAARQYPDVVCAWGANARRDRVDAVRGLLKSAGARLWCLGTTQSGAPRHPLYVPAVQPLEIWL